jgi:hypothetical protein
MIKKIFIKHYLLLFFLTIALISLPKQALAWDPLGWIGKSVAQAVYLIPVQILGFVGLITKGFALLAGALLDWVASGNLIGWGYTNNLVVNIGLGITKQFVNLGIVTVLIVVALLITLNYKAYDGKKILAKLILVALLVNFAPVLIGLIVDASNITMNYFLVGIKDGISGILKGFTGSTETIMQNLDNIKNFSDGLSLLTQACLAIILNIGIGFAFLILFFVFMTRYIMIWLLTILSPLAFVAWVLPNTKKYWDMWWKQVIQWSIIGIPMAFFLYLAMASYQGIAAVQTNITISEMNSGAVQWFNSTFPYVLVLVMLYLGFILGLETSAMGAKTFTGWSQAVGNRIKQTPRWAAGKAWQGLNLPDRKLGTNKAGETVTARTLARGITNRWDASRVPGLKWFRPEPLKKFGEQEGLISGLKKEITGSSEDEADKIANGKYTGAKAAATLHALIKDRGDSNDVVQAYLRKYQKKTGNAKMTEKELFENEDFLNDQTLTRSLEYLQQAGMKSKALRIDPRLAKIGRGRGEEAKKKGFEEMNKLAVNQKPGDITAMEKEAADDKDYVEMMLAHADEGRLRAWTSLKGGGEARQNRVDEVFADWVKVNKDKCPDPKNYAKNWEEYSKDVCIRTGVKELGFNRVLENRPQQLAAMGLGGGLVKIKPSKSPADAVGLGQPPQEKTILNEFGEKDKSWSEIKAEKQSQQKEKETPPPTPEPPKTKDGYIPGSGMGPGKEKKTVGDFPEQITRDMKQQILDLGYTRKQLGKMTPEDIMRILNK